MHKLFVEFIGTMFLAFVVFASGNYMAIGLALAIAAFLGGPISGGAYNPAIAIAMFSAGKLANADLVPYIIAEIGGGLLGAYLSQMLL